MFAPKHRKYKLFALVNRRVVPGLSRLSKSLCVQSLCAFFLPKEKHVSSRVLVRLGPLGSIAHSFRESRSEFGPGKAGSLGANWNLFRTHRGLVDSETLFSRFWVFEPYAGWTASQDVGP